jgi:hypothetical protein
MSSQRFGVMKLYWAMAPPASAPERLLVRPDVLEAMRGVRVASVGHVVEEDERIVLRPVEAARRDGTEARLDRLLP